MFPGEMSAITHLHFMILIQMITFGSGHASFDPQQDIAMCALAKLIRNPSQGWSCNGSLPLLPTCQWSNVECANNSVTSIYSGIQSGSDGKEELDL